MAKNLVSRLGAAALGLSLAFSPMQNARADNSFKSIEKEEVIVDLAKDPGFFKSKGYSVFGGKYYFPDMEYPVSEQTPNYSPLQGLKVPLKEGKQKIKGADESGFVAIPADSSCYFRAEYHLKDLDLGVPLKDFFDSTLAVYKEKGIAKQYTKDQVETILDKSKLHIALFSSEDFDLIYRVGTTLLTQSNGYQEGGTKLSSPRAPIKSWYKTITGEDKNTLVAILNGTYHNQDALRTVNGTKKNPGLILDGEKIDEPISSLATLAIYNDNSFNIGKWEDTPRKEEIKFLRQNEYLSLHDGIIEKSGAFPSGWKRFEDEILRSYLASTPDNKHFAYIWTTYTPPALAAKALQQIGFDDLMMLDIHPVIAGILRKPQSGQLTPMTKANSYQFVPNEEEAVGLISGVVHTFRQKTIQWNHYIPLSGTLPHDFFTVHRKSENAEYKK